MTPCKVRLPGGSEELQHCYRPKNRRRVPSKFGMMKGSAVDFLTKSVVEEALLASIDRALLQARTNLEDAVDNVKLLIRTSVLDTPRT